MCHENCTCAISGGDHLAKDFIQLDVRDGELPVFHVEPNGGATHGGVMIVHDIFGASEFYEDLARRLASEGFAVALPDFFFRHGPLPEDRQARRERGTRAVQDDLLHDMTVALGWLEDHTGQAPSALGMCWGGTAVMLAAARSPRLAAAVPFYGFPVRERNDRNPIIPLDAAEIEQIHTPLLGFWGDQDHGVGMNNVKTYGAALDSAGKPHEFIVYPGLGHGFLTFDPNDAAYADSQDAWSRAVTFLRAEMGTTGE